MLPGVPRVMRSGRSRPGSRTHRGFSLVDRLRASQVQWLLWLRALIDPNAARPADKAECKFIIERIKAAAASGSTDATLDAFKHFRTRAPAVAIRSDPAIRALIAVGLFDYAELVIKEGLRRRPNDRDLGILYGEIARERHDWAEMARRFGAVSKKFPRDVWPWVLQGIALKELRRFDEADKLLEKAISAEPDLAAPRIEYARIAESRGDVAEALRRWKALREGIGDEAGWVEAGRLMSSHGQHLDAARLLEEAQTKFETRPAPTAELARVFERSGRLDEAARQWQILRDRVPQDPRGFVDGSRALRALGHHSEADAILERYCSRANPHPAGVAEWARAAQKSNFSEAARRWQRFRELFPDRAEGYVSGAEALRALGEGEAAIELVTQWNTFGRQRA